MQHEYIRLYGVLNISIGWLIWKLRDVTDGRIGQAIAEAFAMCYVLQCIVICRAQFTDSNGHSLSHWALATIFAILSYSYVYIRLDLIYLPFRSSRIVKFPGINHSIFQISIN